MSNTEKFLEFILILCINLNSIMLPLTFIYFILYLRNDLSSAIVNLQYKNDSEFYIDIEEDTKNVL